MKIMNTDGDGSLQYFTGDVYEGSWKDGLRQGKVCFIDKCIQYL